MLLVYHNYRKITEIFRAGVVLSVPEHQFIAEGLEKLAGIHKNELLIWCAEEVRSNLNLLNLPSFFHHDGLMLSYSPNEFYGIDKAVGYIDATPFVAVNKTITYPAWNMSALVGGVNTTVIKNFSKEKCKIKDFELYLSLMARKGMWQGLCCYSEPGLLIDTKVEPITAERNLYDNLFKFIRFNYKKQWLFYLLLMFLFFEKKFPLTAFCKSFFFKKAQSGNNLLEGIKIQSSKVLDKGKVDVLIPTIGRKKYLYDVLSDLKAQTCLPHSIILVEQNPLPESVSELDYLTKEEWPFEINHIFTHQPGACNARNIALSKVTGDWVFFADDDIRIAPDFLEKALQQLQQYGQTATTLFCHRENERPNFDYPLQWGNFGSGCSLVLAEALKELRFDMRYEFGFGEDGDFGVQLRNAGTDVFYFPKPDILHLKAPVGGFRTKPVLAWEKEPVPPKPSPTVMLYQLKNLTLEQQRSEKVKLFMNFYKHQPIKNPLRYLKVMNQQWEVSRKWALKLLQHD